MGSGASGLSKIAGSSSGDSLTDAIRGYTAQGGQMASQYPFTAEMRSQLFKTASDNTMTTTTDIYRKIDLSQSEYNAIFDDLYQNGTHDVNFDNLQSFTEDRTRAFSYGGTRQQYVLLKIPAGTKVNGLDVKSQSIYPQEQEILLGKNHFVADYSTLDWTSSNNMILTLRR